MRSGTKTSSTMITAALLAAGLFGGCQRRAESPSAPPPNVVQKEMRLLAEAMETSKRAIESGALREIPRALHRVHQAAHETERAIESGAYRPPKNPGDLGRFHELDEAFHGELERLAEASEKDDLPAAKAAYAAAMRGCDGCHAEFRR